MVQLLGVVEVEAHLLAERLVPVGDDIEQVAHRDDVAQLQGFALVDQQLQHHLECGPLPLQQRETAISVCTSAGLNG